MPSAAVEHYIRAIFELEEVGERAATTNIAARLAVAPASVTNMLERLAGMRLVSYLPYRGAELTAAGRALALEAIRHHRLLELYLHEALGYSWDAVHAEADRLEHALSEDLEDRLAQSLRDPRFDPHGDPIPTKDGHVPQSDAVPLADLAIGAPGYVRRVLSQEAGVLRYLEALGLVLDAPIEVLDKAPFAGPVRVRLAGKDQAISLELARAIWVAPASTTIEHRT